MMSVLKMTARKCLPEGTKRILRAVKLVSVQPPPSAPLLPQEALEDCKFIVNRNEMVDHLPSGGKVLEIGTLYGYFANEILTRGAPKELHLVDLDFSKLHDDVRNHQAVKMHQGQSVEILNTFEDECFDWIYVDGDHTYEGVCADIEAAKSKVKPGGYLVFNDFGRIVRRGLGVFGVHQAVCEFIVKDQWQMAYFCFEGEALYDVALKKPE